MIKPLADRIVVKEDSKSSEEVTSFGIVLSGDNKQSRHKEGTVVSIGRGRMAEPRAQDIAGMSASHFAFYPMEVKVGDKVIFMFGEELTIAGEKVYVLKEQDILAVIE